MLSDQDSASHLKSDVAGSSHIDHRPRRLHVYLSYSVNETDKPIVADLAQRLRADGIDVWVDQENLLPGHDWRQEIQSAITASDVVLICLSSMPLTGSSFQSEVTHLLALAAQKPKDSVFLVPVRLDDCKVPDDLRTWQWVDLFSKSGYIQLLRALRTRRGTLATDRDIPSSSEQLALVDTVPTYPDRPIERLEEDELGRAAFARALAIRLCRIREDAPHSSFMLHVNGPWGAGKTSLLHLLRRELEDKAELPWIVIDFNAWQQQRLGDPWWWLLDAVFRQGIGQLRSMGRKKSLLGKIQIWWRIRQIKTRERIWHFKVGPAPNLLALVALLSIALLFWTLWRMDLFGLANYQAKSTRPLVVTIVNRATAIAAALSIVVTVWGGVVGFSRLFLHTSTSAGTAFMQSAKDPMKMLSRQFHELTCQIKYPLAIFVDDIDRCQSAYIIDLLDGIQTLFRDASVTYVVAADRRWLCTSYSKVYEAFGSTVHEPGRPLGYLFLEKIFQLSVSIPRMSSYSQQKYWQRLLLTFRLSRQAV